MEDSSSQLLERRRRDEASVLGVGYLSICSSLSCPARRDLIGALRVSRSSARPSPQIPPSSSADDAVPDNVVVSWHDIRSCCPLDLARQHGRHGSTEGRNSSPGGKQFSVSTDGNMCYMGIPGSRMVPPEPIWTALSFLSTPQMSETYVSTAARPTSPRLTGIDVTADSDLGRLYAAGAASLNGLLAAGSVIDVRGKKWPEVVGAMC